VIGRVACVWIAQGSVNAVEQIMYGVQTREIARDQVGQSSFQKDGVVARRTPTLN